MAQPSSNHPMAAASAAGHTCQTRKCFKCGDPTHGVFQCPLVNATEATEIYEQHKKNTKTLGAAGVPERNQQNKKGPLSYVANWVVKTLAKPDSGAEVSVVTPHLLKELTAAGQWLRYRDLSQSESVTGITAEPIIVTQEVKLDLALGPPMGI
ncbi:hypothetical protein GQ600_22414 [Phytophthora cactorum]|nr:hypothetical protein GQ600_22414 [Phytophthora cactorum]